MTNPLTIKVPASRLMRDMTLTVQVTGLRVLRTRMWLATHLMVLAARVAGCGLHVEIGPK